MHNPMTHLRPALTGFIQVLFVTLTTCFIASNRPDLATASSFVIQLMWTMNVRAVLGSWSIRICYIVGATMGTPVGYWLSGVVRGMEML